MSVNTKSKWLSIKEDSQHCREVPADSLDDVNILSPRHQPRHGIAAKTPRASPSSRAEGVIIARSETTSLRPVRRAVRTSSSQTKSRGVSEAAATAGVSLPGGADGVSDPG